MLPDNRFSSEPLTVHAHACFIYDTADESKTQFIPYLQSGLLQNEYCVYLVDDSSPDFVLEAMQENGFALQPYIDKGTFAIMRAKDAYLSEDYFSEEKMTHYWNDLLAKSQVMGCSATRVVAEMTWALSGSPGCETLAPYEARVNNITDAFEVSIICAYNRSKFPPEKLKAIFHVHPLIIHGDLVLPNPNAVRADCFTEGSAEIDLQVMLDNLTELQKRSEQLENANRRLANLNKKLQGARHEAIAAANVKSAFVANISHELRTPLAGLIGLSDLLLASNLTPSQRNFANLLNGTAHSLLVLVNDVLDLAKIEAGKAGMSSAPFNPHSVVADIAGLLNKSIQGKGLNLKVSIDPAIPLSVIGDATRVRQVLVNLIGNSTKFTESGEIAVSANITSEDTDNVTILFSVADTGIGISADELPLLFERFSQIANSQDRKYSGTGLGLSICKQIVTMMGGEIGVDSVPGKGSTFWFKVPFRRDMQASSGVEQEMTTTSVKQFSGRVALVAEDNAVMQLVTTKLLTNLGLQVQAVSNGKKVLEALESRPYDLILMDCQMPVMDGFETTKLIRQEESNTGKHQIIIALTAQAMSGDRELCLHCGMDDYLDKPFETQQLRAKLEKWIGTSSMVA